MSRRRWIFFDLGWTLVDETEAHLDRLRRLRAVGPRYSAVSDEDFMGLCERHAAHFAPSPFLAALQGLDPAGWESAKRVARYEHSHERLYPIVPDLLRQLQGSSELGLIANQSAGTADRLKSFGIHNSFSVIVTSAETGFSKPDPRIFVHAQAVAGCRPGDATMVGDRLDNDIGPARAAGWRTIRVLQGFARYQQPRGAAESPDHTIASIDELPSCVG